MVSAVALVRLALFLGSPLERQIGVIPDDAFYYLVSAKNFAELGRWTFDGQAAASGFHLLHAYLLAGLFRLAPRIGDAALFTAVDGFATLLYAGAAFFCSRAVGRDFGTPGLLGVVLAFSAPIALQQQTFMVESCLVIFFSSALLEQISAARGEPAPARGELALAFALGLLGNLSRSDFGPFAAACAIVLGLWGRRRAAALAASATLGAALGIAILMLHTQAFSGTWIQSSARTKSRWSALLGYDLRGYVRVLVDLVAARDLRWLRVLSLPLLVLAAGLFGAWRSHRAHRLQLGALPLALACGLAIAFYALFYGRTSAGVPPWYLAHALAPAAYLMAAVTGQIQRRGLGPAAAVVAAAAALGVSASLTPIWPHQPVMIAAGRYLASHPELEPVAAWNAGMMSFYARRPVTNLDGLINDDIYAYASSDRLLDYLCRRRIQYLLDFSEMLDDPYLRTRGGYADGRLVGALHEQLDLSRGDPTLRWTDTDMKLYQLDSRACAPE